MSEVSTSSMVQFDVCLGVITPAHNGTSVKEAGTPQSFQLSLADGDMEDAKRQTYFEISIFCLILKTFIR